MCEGTNDEKIAWISVALTSHTDHNTFGRFSASTESRHKEVKTNKRVFKFNNEFVKYGFAYTEDVELKN